MSFKDLFHSERRSKDDLLREISLRDIKISKFQDEINQLKDAINDVKKPSGSNVLLSQNLSGQLVGAEPIEVQSDNHVDININAENPIILHENLHLKLRLKIKSLENDNYAISSELRKAIRNRVIDRLALNLKFVAEKKLRLISEYKPLMQVVTKEARINESAVRTAETRPSMARAYYPEAHRILRQREDHIELLELMFDDVLARFGIKDRNHLIDIVNRLKELDQLFESQKNKLAEQELIQLKAKLIDVNSSLKLITNERDESRKVLAIERAHYGSEARIRLSKQLDEANREIIRLQSKAPNDLWSLKSQIDTARKSLEDRELDLRNKTLRVGELTKERDRLRLQSVKFQEAVKANGVQVREILKLQNDLHLAKNQSALYLADINAVNNTLKIEQKKVLSLQANLDKVKDQILKSTVSDPGVFSDPILLRWLVEGATPDKRGVTNGWLTQTGQGPWTDYSIIEICRELGYEFWELPDGEVEKLIVGRENWSKADLLAQIEARQGDVLRIYSQEMFIAKLITGRDPFDAEDENLLLAFANGHPALSFLMTLSDPWPVICEGDRYSIEEVGRGDYGVDETPLHLLGYHVGATSDLSDSRRHELLAECFQTSSLKFTDTSTASYKKKWGRSLSAQRLYRIAIHIKYLADTQGLDKRKSIARQEWINDLSWLKKTYYKNYKNSFKWP